ncbi:TetR family transcriptional regulator [Corynebacterium tapiri]|uniref:TetR family transcriptional regulator n=1 Tax=Corynebacterium tapiri TaxID=1448266 RepID=A0A5C4U5P3_9CORY|nr:TetR family transcriptional regulator [Corynebacterium tapiri]TNL99363.1 TetR family transcriptional regulator [Corynebacterium tapiri]
MNLTRDAIVDAALTILDTYGLADMTMRRVATHLSVAPGALYWHVANKQALIAALAQRIVEPALNSPAQDAHERTQLIAGALVSHRDAAELCSIAIAQPESAVRREIEESLTTALGSIPDSPVAARALLHLLLGACVNEQTTRQLAAAAGSDVVVSGYGVSRDVETQVALLLRGLGQATPLD